MKVQAIFLMNFKLLDFLEALMNQKRKRLHKIVYTITQHFG